MPSLVGRLAPALRAGRHRIRRGHVRGVLNLGSLCCFVVMAAMLHPIAGVGTAGVALAVWSLALDDKR